MPKEPLNATDWNAVAARALAVQALYLAGFAEKSLTSRARFLMVLGRADAAGLLGSSDDSLRHMLARENKKEAGTTARQERSQV